MFFPVLYAGVYGVLDLREAVLVEVGFNYEFRTHVVQQVVLGVVVIRRGEQVHVIKDNHSAVAEKTKLMSSTHNWT